MIIQAATSGSPTESALLDLADVEVAQSAWGMSQWQKPRAKLFKSLVVGNGELSLERRDSD